MAGVLHMLDSLNRGGAETLVLDICRNAQRSENEILFVASGGGDLESEFMSLELPTFFFERRLPLDPFLIRNLRRVIVENEIRIAQGYQPVEVLHLWFASIGLDVRIVHSFQGGGWMLHSGKDQAVARFMAERVALNVTCSTGMLSDISDRLRIDTSDFEVVLNSVDENKLCAESGHLREELGISPGTLLGGNVANFIGLDVKDQFTICRALGELMSKFEDLHFVFVGKTTETGQQDFEKCKEFVRSRRFEDRVHFLGQRTDVPRILADLDFFVMASKHEGLGIAAAEAMLVGIPTFLTNIPPFLEASDSGKHARHFDPEDYTELSKLLAEFIERPEDLKDAAMESVNYAVETFSIGAHIRRLDSLYAGLLDD